VAGRGRFRLSADGADFQVPALLLRPEPEAWVFNALLAAAWSRPQYRAIAACAAWHFNHRPAAATPLGGTDVDNFVLSFPADPAATVEDIAHRPATHAGYGSDPPLTQKPFTQQLLDAFDLCRIQHSEIPGQERSPGEPRGFQGPGKGPTKEAATPRVA
jgi:hypothetical protein